MTTPDELIAMAERLDPKPIVIQGVRLATKENDPLLVEAAALLREAAREMEKQQADTAELIKASLPSWIAKMWRPLPKGEA